MFLVDTLQMMMWSSGWQTLEGEPAYDKKSFVTCSGTSLQLSFHAYVNAFFNKVSLFQKICF